MGLRELTTYKYVVWGDGQVRSSPAWRSASRRSTTSSDAAPARRRLPRRRHHRRRRVPRRPAREAGARRRAGRGRQDRAGQGAEPHPPASRLIRLQCYEGLDEAKALYEWNYKKQLLRIQVDREHESSLGRRRIRHLLRAVPAHAGPCWRPSAPRSPSCCSSTRSTGSRSRPRRCSSRSSPTSRCRSPSSAPSSARQRPLVVLTSNNTRELSEALKRRCLYLHVDYPDLEREKDIVRVRVPDIDEALAEQIARVVRLDPRARAEEGALDLRDDRLGPHAAVPRDAPRSRPR